MYESLITPPSSGAKTTGPAPSGPTSIDAALAAEGVTGRAAEFVKSVYQQESSSGSNTKTSNAGAVGGMQIIPATFKSVADAGWDINNPEHNLRAGIRYAKQGFEAAGGDPALAGAYYYGGPGGMNKARQGVAVSDPRNPRAPNTLQYGQQVASRMSGEPAAAPADDQFYAPQRGQYASLITPPPERTFGGAVADTGLAFGQGAVGAFKSISDLAGANNPVSETLEGASKFLQSQKSAQSQAALANSQERVRAAEATGDWKEEVGAYMQMLWDQPAELIAQGVGSFATLGVGKIAQAAKLARAAKASGMSKEAFFKTKEGIEAVKAAADAGFKANIGVSAAQGVGTVKGAQYEQTFNAAKAQGMSDEEAAALATEAQAYGGAGTGQQILGGVLGAGAAAVGPIERLIAGKAASKAASVPMGTAKGFFVEGGTEGLQGGQERAAGNEAAIDAGVLDESQRFKGVAGQFAMEGAIGGVLGAGGGAMESALAPKAEPAPVVPPELKPVADAAAAGGALSKAALAGATSAAQTAASQPAEQQVDPATRLAQLEAIGKDQPDRVVKDGNGNSIVVPGEKARFFTQEEKAEYDQLKTLRDATPGANPADTEKTQEKDEFTERANAISTALRTNSGLEALRSKESPVDVKSFLNDLAIAKSKSSPAHAREQAIARLEFAAEWLGLDPAAAQPQAAPERQFSPEAKEWMQSRKDAQPTVQTEQQIQTTAKSDEVGSMANTAKLSPQDKQDVAVAISNFRNPSLPAKTRQLEIERALAIIGRTQAPAGQANPGQTPAVLKDIPPQPGTPEYFEREAVRREDGAYQFRSLGYDQEADLLLAEADQIREMAASARAGELGMELSGDEVADNSSPVRQQSVDEATKDLPRVQIPAEDAKDNALDNTAARRKRKGQISQLVANGFETVEVKGKQFLLTNAKTGQQVTLDSPADAQLARAAIARMVADKANTAAASPLNDRLEPTEAQIAAGNYKKSDVIELNGMKITIENPAGSTRRGVSPDGKAWETKMAHHYGEFVGTEGADGDRLDVFIGPRPDSAKVYVIDQKNKDGSFDESKVVMGATSEEQARQVYLSNYEPGWDGLGAITEMSLDDFKAWAKSERAKQPLMLGKQDKVITVNDGGNPVQILPLDTAEVGDASAARTGKGKVVSKKDADLIKSIGAIFGVDVQFFRPVTPGFDGDGFFNGGNTLYINERTTVTPLAIFGHEFMHLIKERMPQAYDSIAKVVSANVKDPKGYRADYYGQAYADEKGDAPLTAAELEELVSDLNGNLMTSSSFWRDVFAQVAKDHGKEAKGIIARLSAFLGNAIDMVVSGLKGGRFNAGQFVNNTKDIRAAFKDGLAQYLAASDISKTAMQAEILRAEQKGKKGADIKRSAPRPTDGLTVDGYHFSKEARPTLTTGAYGTGLQGSDRDEIMAAKDGRLKQRLSFYVNKGTGVRPESGVGGIAHKAELTNLYDADADAKRLKQGRGKRDFESAVLDAGYSGYLTRLDGSQPGQAILLGAQTVQPEVLGPRTQIPEAKPVPAAAQRDMDLGDKIAANKALPSGSPTASRWAQILMATMPEDAAKLMDLGVLDGNDNLYKDELVARIRKAQPQIKKSAARAKQEYDDVEAKYKGTDAWMKAPNGQATKLTERQWVQTRTPSFQSWFGPWLEAAEKGDIWSRDDVSKVVDDNGEPLVVYHGTTKGGFSEFNQPGGEKRGDLGIFATDNYDMARSYVRKGGSKDIKADDLAYEGAEIKDLGFALPNGNRWVLSLDGGKRQSYYATEEDAQDALESMGGKQTAGIYALFLNIKNPNEANFEGALWNGSRDHQWVVEFAGEQQYTGDGKGYFDSKEEAAEFAETFVNPDEDEDPLDYVRGAEDHYEDTDGVVREAARYKNDGAIIRQVVDDGGGPGAYAMEPADVYVALNPEQVKSADFNGGEFSEESRDIRKSKARQDPAIGDKTDVAKLPAGKPIPESVAVGSLEKSLEMARSKSYRRGRELKQDLQSRVLAAARAAKTSLSNRTQELHKFLAGMVVGDAEYALQSNENAVGWYDKKVSRALGALSTVHPEIDEDPRSRLAFLWALATTSNGLKVDKNFELAEKAYSTWKRTGQMPTKYGIGNAAQAINKGLDYYNELAPKIGDERLLKFMSTMFTVGEINRMLGVKPGGEWMGTPVRGAAILGPKIGNGFFSNLNGYFDALTMDRWLMRTWGRMTGTLIDVDPKAIAQSRSKLANAATGMTVAERRQFADLIGIRIPAKPTKVQLDAIAKASQKASMKTDKREVMISTDAMNTMRKAANLHHMTLDGQKEAPSGPAERNWVRAVFQTALEQLRSNGKDMTMSDLQALLWYPERRLYDAAKSDEDVSNGYEDDEAPDYANAGMNLAISRGVSKTSVLAAMDAAEARGTVQGAQLTSEEKAAMLEEFRSAPEQKTGFAFEVAPDPNNEGLTRTWSKLDTKEKARITKLVKDAVLADVVDAVGAKVGKTASAIGGYMGLINPNLITEYKHSQVPLEQARAMAAAIGLALDQDSVAMVDPRAGYEAGIIRLTLSVKAEKVADKLFATINKALPEVDAFTARGNNFDILNFTDTPTETLVGKIEEAISDLDDGYEITTSFGVTKSELIEKADYENHIKGLRPESWQDVLGRVQGARDRAREIVAAELGRRPAGEVPESAGSARRADDQAQAEQAREVVESAPRNEEPQPAAEPAMKDEVSPEEARGLKVTQEVEVEETGKTAKLSVDAERALADYNQRIESMKQLIGCLKK